MNTKVNRCGFLARTGLAAMMPMAMVVAVLAGAGTSPGAVVINELMAATSEQRLSWDAGGVPHLGSGAQWVDPGFNTAGWTNTLLPAGYAFAGLASDLTSQMKGLAPSLYLRKEFQATPDQAASTNGLVFSVQYNDGFVAYLNGREAARANCGPTNHFIFASQPAYNVSTTTNVVQFTLGPASAWLVSGSNVLALQAHNAEQPSTTNWPEQITAHTPTPEFRINAGLQLAGDTPVGLIGYGPTGGAWRSFVGRAEPSGGVVDMGLVTKSFTPPAGEEDDYEQPAEFSDWIELYNNGAAAADIGGWSLSDEPDLPGKWHFPTNTVLPAGGYLLVLCDNRDEANAPAGPATRLHTNFKLDEQGGQLMLFDKLGQLVDGLPDGYPAQVPFCSYGRNPGAAVAFGFLSTATPGASNAGPFYAGRVDPPQFQAASGFDLHGGIYQTQSLVLYLRDTMAGSLIRYTLDASEPTDAHGIVYTNPIILTQANDKTGKVVRAAAFLPGWLPSEVKTHTYLLQQPAALTNVPALIFTGDAGRNFYAPGGLLAIVGGTFIPVSVGAFWQANGPQSYDEVLGSGTPFERPARLEYYFPPGYYPTNQSPLRTDIGLRVSSSGFSRPRMKMSGATNSPWQPYWDSTEKPSFNLYFAGDFGSGPLDYPLFTNYPVNEFQQLRLRAGKNDNGNPFITDELVRRLWLDMGHVGARGLFCSLYVNAVYKGVFNLCERFREPFFQAHYASQASWDVDYSWTWVDGDNTVFQQLLTALDLNLTNLTNWRAVTNKLDIDNAADYYLLNIYAAMWDWPGNNFVIARERSTGPDSRFRFAVWDAEGAFNAIGYSHPVSYNTITTDLVVPSTDPNYWVDVARIFRRLASSPEFRLRFADRVNFHLFNGGILDDRDPDGAGPLKSHFGQRLTELVQEAGALVQYNTGQPLDQSAFNTWAASGSGRRSYLLGAAPGRQMLRDAGLWPLTEPPVFSRYGGAVPPGYGLSLTSSVATPGQTATLYYTLEGSDPRLAGGGRNLAAQTYAGPVALNQVLTVKARARNNTTSEWSPITEATFAPAAVPASSNNLVLAELMYHPPHATAAELAAGFSNADDFEFVRLLNISSTPVDLAGVRFTLGVTFDFTSGAFRYLSPGANALAVKNRDAFQVRYGHGYDALIAGEYAANFSNGGERVQLVASNNVVLRDFTYGTSAPWPATADGQGPSLVLRLPASNPDPADPANWTASAVPGGLPGGVAPQQSYAAWRALYWDTASATNDSISGPRADPDGDGVCNFLEYTFGLDPHHVSEQPQPRAAIESVNGDLHLTLSFRMAPGAQDSHLTWEISSELRNWSTPPNVFELLSTEPCLDGTATVKYVDTTPLASSASRFVRLRLAGP
jgi:hypothetical protein